MKDVGYTQEGGRLVEMNKDEYAEFSMLCAAIEGSSFPQPLSLRDYGFMDNLDLSTTFGVIRAYYWNKFYVNQMQKFLDDMKKELDKKES